MWRGYDTHTHTHMHTHRIGRLGALQQSLHEQLGSLEEQQSRERVTNQRSLKKEMQQMQTRLLQESVSVLLCSSLGFIKKNLSLVTVFLMPTAKARNGPHQAITPHYAYEALTHQTALHTYSPLYPSAYQYVATAAQYNMHCIICTV